jgi:hypothetical protein
MIKMKEKANHLSKDCPDMLINCGFCEMSMPRKENVFHQNVCPETVVTCSHPGNHPYFKYYYCKYNHCPTMFRLQSKVYSQNDRNS